MPKPKLDKKLKIILISIFSLLLIVLIILGAIKISAYRKAYYYRYTDAGRREKVLIYLERKYEQEFEILKMVDETIAFSVPNYQADCIPKGGNQETECFTVWILPNGKLSFDSSGVVFDDRHAADNYFGVLIKPEIERLLREIVSKYFDDTEIRITLNSRYEYELNESSQYVDFIDRGYHILTGISILNVAYNEEETLRLIHEMYVDFKKSGLDVWGQVYYSYKNEESQTVSSRITMDTEKV